MPPLLKRLLHPYMAPAGDADGGGGQVLDYGDDFTPTDDATDPAAEETKPKAKEPAPKTEEVADPDELLTDEEKEAKAAKEAEEKKESKKDTRIPLNRHKEILDKERGVREGLERELAKYKGGQQVAATNEQITEAEDALLKMEKDYNKAVSDGKVDEASALMSRIRRTERNIIEAKADLKTQAAEARAYERVRFDVTIERLEAAYPVMNPDHDSYDEATVKEVLELKDAYQLKGYTPSQAAQKACTVLLGAETRKQEQATTTEARVTEKDVAAERKAAAVKKNVDTQGKQPPNTAKVGQDSDQMGGRLDAKAIMKMSQAEFAKVDEKELARLRGDEL